MRRIIKIPLLLLLIISFYGCSFEGNSFSEDQEKAISNSIDFINDSSFTTRERFDTDKIKIENPTDNTSKVIGYIPID